ncbi:vitamin K epoxide reductase family protein [Microcoleus sp. FACHB-1515]|uniref:vitamin K epoxide reductase family protein n=1 Tax=Cyanophyceae TaxID=3028117 RepID=UPI001682F7CE|nr:vitamin K epoxide reductase family protein [Microcoleus sp. FACHB-1515]MBD2090806.1 vitamin K epoxide reductase family protein [Microcoleus sp. FACHB-1515]
MEPSQLSRELREGKNPDLSRRRLIIGLSGVGALMGEAVSLYQVGMIKELPDPPIPLIDSSKVDASNYAYKRFDTPDGFMMVTNYSITALIAAAGGMNRATQNPILPIALAIKTFFDSALALWLAREEWDENQAFCAYCQVATLCSIVSFALAIPEALAATRYMLGKRKPENA